VKQKLARAMNAMLDPMRERRREVMARPEHIRQIAMEGSKKARAIAHQTMERVREAVKLRY
jgi:tryptophanyl-tRNA synthetase